MRQMSPGRVTGGPAADLNHGIGGVVIACQRQLADQQVDFRQLEAGQGNVEIDIEIGEVLQLKTEQFTVPAGIFGQTIIGDHVSPNFGFAHRRQTHRRNLVEANGFGSFDPAVPGDDPVGVIDQHGVGKAKATDRAGDLADLLLRMGPGIGCARLERAHGLVVDRKEVHGKLHGLRSSHKKCAAPV